MDQQSKKLICSNHNEEKYFTALAINTDEKFRLLSVEDSITPRVQSRPVVLRVNFFPPTSFIFPWEE